MKQHSERFLNRTPRGLSDQRLVSFSSVKPSNRPETHYRVYLNAKCARDFDLSEGMRCLMEQDAKGELYMTFGDDSLSEGRRVRSNHKYHGKPLSYEVSYKEFAKSVCDRHGSEIVKCAVALNPIVRDGKTWYHVLTVHPIKKSQHKTNLNK